MKVDEYGVLRTEDGRILPCPKCGKRIEPEFQMGPFGPHWAKCTCKACRSVWFPPKPGKRKNRESRHTELVRRFGRGFCELCGILQARLPAGEAFEGHHVDEYHLDGEPTRENTWILCTACHRLVHWRRIYLKHLLPDGVANVHREERTTADENASELGPVENDLP